MTIDELQQRLANVEYILYNHQHVGMDRTKKLTPSSTIPAAGVAGSNTAVQFNNNGSFDGSNNFTWNGNVLQIIGQYASKEYDNGNVSGTWTANWNNSNVQYATLTGTSVVVFTNPSSGGRYLLQIAGAFPITFPTTVRWTGGSTPTPTATAGKKDLYTLIYSSKEGLYDILQSPNYSIT